MFEIDVVLRVKTQENKEHSYHCPQNTNLFEVYQVLCHMTKMVKDKIEEVEKHKEEDMCCAPHEECPEQAKEALNEKEDLQEESPKE